MPDNKAKAITTEGDGGPNVVQTAIAAGLLLADAKVNPSPHGHPYVVLTGADGIQNVEYLEKPDLPPRRTGTVLMADTESFLEYWKRQSDDRSYIYGSIVPARFTAVLDEQHRDRANWRDHRIVYQLEHSDEWTTWTKHSRVPFGGNEAFAVWLEDNLLDIIVPDPAMMMDIALNIRIHQDQRFGSSVGLTDGKINFTYVNDVTADAGSDPTKVGEKLAIPATFKIAIPVFKGRLAPKYEIEARFRYRQEGGKLMLRYELVRPHKVIEKAFIEMLDKIQVESGTVVLFGQPEGSK